MIFLISLFIRVTTNIFITVVTWHDITLTLIKHCIIGLSLFNVIKETEDKKKWSVFLKDVISYQSGFVLYVTFKISLYVHVHYI